MALFDYRRIRTVFAVWHVQTYAAVALVRSVEVAEAVAIRRKRG